MTGGSSGVPPSIVAIAAIGTLLSLLALALSGYAPGAASSLTPSPDPERPGPGSASTGA